MAKVGTSFIDITDLTETLPLTLMLETNREQNVQIKNGDLYTPNFKEGEGLIITPSLFIGQTEIIPFPYENIRYQVGEKDSENNTELDFSYANKHGYSDISVDEEGRLIYKKNLEKDLIIEARIEGYKHKDKDDIVASSVNASNPKTILFLEQGSNLYNLIITSENGREHFEESNREPILLKAILYKGTQEVTNVTYEWDIVTDTDTDSDEDNNYPSGPDFRVVGQNLEVQRSWVSTLEVFQCIATLNDGSNLKFEAQKIIRDFVDNFSATIISDKARILNPENPEITLTNNIYHLGNLVTDTSRITSYSWFLFYKNQEEKLIQEGASNALVINLNAEENIFPKEDFSILCVALIDGKERVVTYTDIIYRETFYRPVVSPKTIFVPVNKNGIPTSETFSHEIKFQLVDDGNNVLDYIGQTSFAPSLDSKDNSSFGIISQTVGKWEFKIPFSLDLSNNNDFWISNSNSKIYEFTYTYLNTEFTEEFEVVKNYAGADGSPGFSGYTIDLSNEFHAFPGGEMRADSNQSTSCLVSAYFGDARKKIKKIEIGNIDKKEIYPTSNEIEYIVPNNKGYLYFSSQKKQDNEININIKTATSGDRFLTGIEPIPIYITIEGQDGKDLIFFKTFTYTINYNGKSYFLNLSENNIKYSEPTNTYSPNQITISALCRETSGSAQPYNEGKIIYSVDEGKNWKYYENSPIITNSGIKLESIMVRLYSTLAKRITSGITLNNSLLNENSKYLLDTETIPVLTSMDGYEFGGENLIKWSKDIPIEINKWSKSDEKLFLSKDGDFSIMNFNVSDETSDGWRSFRSPKIKLSEDYLNNTFCLSFLVKMPENNIAFDELFFANVAGYVNFEDTLRSCFKEIAYFSQNSNEEFICNEKWEKDKWLKVYKTFDLNEMLQYDKISFSDISKCSYFNINFFLQKNGFIQIKQPKLEIGTIPTAWSASPYDIDYSNISGANLATIKSYTHQISTQDNPPYLIFAENLEANTYYTFSCATTAIENIQLEDKDSEEFLIGLSYREENNSSTSIIDTDFNFTFLADSGAFQQKTFKTPEENKSYLIKIFPTNSKTVSNNIDQILTLTQAKIEKGTQATSFFLTEEYLNDLITTLDNTVNDNNNNILTIIGVDGTLTKKVQKNTNTLENLGLNKYLKIDDAAAKITAVTDKYYEASLKVIAQIQNKTEIDSEYIIISSQDTGATTNKKYFATSITSKGIDFLEGVDKDHNKSVASITGETLQINNAIFNNTFKIGDLIVSLTDTGIGFSW